MYRFSVLLINDISAFLVFTKEGNHSLISLCMCSDICVILLRHLQRYHALSNDKELSL